MSTAAPSSVPVRSTGITRSRVSRSHAARAWVGRAWVGRAWAVGLGSVLFAAVTLSGGGVAGAHTEVLRAEPGPAQRVDAPVTSIAITFLDQVLPGIEIEVRDDVGALVTGIGPSQLSADGRRVVVDIGPVSTPGRYTVDFEFASLDGDLQRESYQFSVMETGAVGRSGVPAVAVGSLGVIALTIGVAVRRRVGAPTT